MSFNFVQNEKMTFWWDCRGTMGENGNRFIVMNFLCSQSKYLIDISIFHFGINIGVASAKKYEKDNLYREIELNLFWKIWMICKFFVTGGSEGTRLTARKCHRHMTCIKCKKWPAILFCHWDFRTCPSPADMVKTWPGQLKLSWSILCIFDYDRFHIVFFQMSMILIWVSLIFFI